MHPEIITLIAGLQDITVLEKSIKALKDNTKIENCLELLYDKEDKAGGEMTIEEIKNIKGI